MPEICGIVVQLIRKSLLTDFSVFCQKFVSMVLKKFKLTVTSIDLLLH